MSLPNGAERNWICYYEGRVYLFYIILLTMIFLIIFDRNDLFVLAPDSPLK